MRNLILGAAGVMVAGMVVAMFFYQSTGGPMPQSPNLGLPEQSSPQSEQKPEELQPIDTLDPVSYSLQKEELNITFDGGSTWAKVPVEKSQLFSGEYNGNQQELIPQSYILTEDRSAFIYTEGPRLLLAYSNDKGQTWQHLVVSEELAPIRYRKVEFLNDQFGYVIVTGDRTMSSEGTSVFLTKDGGNSWQMAAASGTTRLLFDAGFIDESTGFLSYGILNPEAPDLYVTQDGGNSWTPSSFSIPKKYSQIFVTAEVPFKEADGLSVLLNQGPNGDYKGGKVKGKFISKDNGLTWEFAEEVDPVEEG